MAMRGRSRGRSLDTDDITVSARRRRAVPHAARGTSSSAAARGAPALYMHDDMPVARRMPSPMARRGLTLGNAHTTTTTTVLNLHTANGWVQGGATGLARARAQAAETLLRLGKTSPAVGHIPRSHRTALRVLQDGASATALGKSGGGKAAAEAAGRVTGTAEAVGRSKGNTCTVKAGETPYSLATAHNTSVAAMQHLNNLAGDSILVGR
jgi:LysM repeat protein